ncbi:MAG: peptidylprolyl isomerase, partial [Nitrosospira sp.]|nr:peptidylprolyl isomerase [Nitrosospira sp.]
MGTKYLLRPPVLLAILTAGIAVVQQPAYPGSSGIETIDHIVAVVNESVITRHELDEMLKVAVKQLQSQGIQPPAPAALEKQLLERVILNRVQLQLAKETGLTIPDADLDQTIRRIAQENKMSLPEFHNALERDGISFNQFRDEIRDEIILVRLKEREVSNRINVTEGEVDNFLQAKENSSEGEADQEYRLAHILVQLPQQAEASKIQAMRQRAEEAMAQLKNGVEFAKVAAEFSDSADATQGGLLDWRPAAQLTKKFAEILAPMKPGEIAEIIQSPNGFHILKLIDRRSQKDAVTMVDQIHARHILIKVNE